ncbi:MAG: hypothetical protein JXK95_15320, partial [Bacteroidales bacterium]|nr:hypothetical protein [Bacteroidales bacterium]
MRYYLSIIIVIFAFPLVKSQVNVIQDFPFFTQSNKSYESNKNDCGEWAVASIFAYWNNHAFGSYYEFDRFLGEDFSPDFNYSEITELSIELQEPLDYSPNGTWGTAPFKMKEGIQNYCNDQAYGNNYNFVINEIFDGSSDSHILWDAIKFEIDQGRPVLFLITGGVEYKAYKESTGEWFNFNEWKFIDLYHYMPIVGYNSDFYGEGRKVIIASSLSGENHTDKIKYYIDIESIVPILFNPAIWTIIPQKNNEKPSCQCGVLGGTTNLSGSINLITFNIESEVLLQNAEYQINVDGLGWSNAGYSYNINDDLEFTYNTSHINFSNNVQFRSRLKTVLNNYSDWTYSSIYTIDNSSQIITNGIISNRFPVSGESVVFRVDYINTINTPPSEVRVFINGTGYTMTKDPSDNDFSDGVEYTYTTTFSTAKIYQYSFGANANDGTELEPYPEDGSTLNFVVNENPAGWDLRVTNLSSSPTYMISGQGVTFTGTIHNNSNSPDKTYTNIFYKFELFNPSGSLIDEESGTLSSLSQGASSNVSRTLYTQSTTGNYNCVFSVYPSKDANTSNNSASNTVIVGTTEPTHQYLISESDKEQFLYVGDSYNGYTLMGIGSNYANVRYNGTTHKVYYQDFKEIESSTRVIMCEGISNIGGDAAVLSFGTSNLNYVSFDQTTITCHAGDEIIFTAVCGIDFANTDPDIYRNSSIDANDWSISRSSDRNTAYYEYDLPNNMSNGTYTFFIGSSLSGGKYLRKLTVKVISPTPTISALSKNAVSADDQITISGSNFSSSGIVRFNSISAIVSSWSGTSITCIVPQGIIDGVVTVTTSDGTSNGISYTVNSSTGNPILVYEIPDQTMNQGETRIIADLNNVFDDPNDGSLTFSASSSNCDISINSTVLSSGTLELTTSSDIMSGATITISATDNTSKSVSDNFTIDVPKILRVSPAFAFVEKTAGITNFPVTSNINWSVIESSGWLNANKTNATTLSVEYDENTSVDDRSASITLSGTGVTSQTITVEQDGATPILTISPSSRSVGSSSGTTTFTVTSNIDWSVIENTDWLSAARTSSNILTVYYDVNCGESRYDNITLSGIGVPQQTVVVNQADGIITAPTIGTITQPTCAVSTGSVVLSGLPSTGTWTLTRTPGGTTTSGTGTSTTLSGLPTGTYTYT